MIQTPTAGLAWKKKEKSPPPFSLLRSFALSLLLFFFINVNPTTPTATTPTPAVRFCFGCKVDKAVAYFCGSTGLYKTCVAFAKPLSRYDEYTFGPTPATNESTRTTTVTDEMKAFLRIASISMAVGLYEQFVQVYGFVVDRGQVLGGLSLKRRTEKVMISCNQVDLGESMLCESSRHVRLQ